MRATYGDVDPFDPAIDQPLTLDYDEVATDRRFPLSNAEIQCQTDRNCDLYDLFWTWHDRPYARSIQVHFSAPIYTQSGISTDPVDEIMPFVVRFYPGYQETIFGTESGVILSKRIFAPLGSHYDRSLLWLLECQAEGDRLVRIEVDIDWGRPLEQRMVDGLLVAQANPGEAKGAHQQQNAESTRVFGTGGGRPDWVHFPDEQSAQLVYHLLVAGQVDLPLILTLSDVGEQVAWNGFLAQRDISRSFKLSQDVWSKVSRNGRLWTPYPPLNWAVQWGKEAAVADLRRLRTGYAPRDRRVASVPPLVELFDSLDVTRSRFLLEHLKQSAQKNGGRLPVELPLMPSKTAAPDPGLEVIDTNHAYLHALSSHISRQPDAETLQEHYASVRSCVQALLDVARGPADLSARNLHRIQIALYMASRLAAAQGNEEDEIGWAKEAQSLAPPLPDEETGHDSTPPIGGWDWLDRFTQIESLTPDPLIRAASDAIWVGCGVSVRNDEIVVTPRWPSAWGWWAILDLPVAGDTLTLLWDGQSLHTTQRVRFEGDVEIHDHIAASGSDADSFSLRFHLRTGRRQREFQPIFYAAESWRTQESVRGLWRDG